MGTMDNQADERSQLERARNGDEDAFMALYRRHRDALFRFAYRLTGDTGTAEDVAHDCWLALLDGKARWNPARGPLLPFVLGIARHLAWQRLQYQERECSDDASAYVPSPDTPLRYVLACEVGSAVERAMGELPPLQREAVVLFEYEGLSLEEIAGMAGVEVGTVKGRLHRAREALRRKLAFVRS
jgi:RNA polymerase sigma-70 factor, ECF subfamily